MQPTNLIPYNFNLNQEARGTIDKRKLMQVIMGLLAVSSSLSIALSAYSGEKEKSVGMAVTLSVSFLISDGAAVVWAYLKFEDEIRRSLLKYDQEISKESGCFSASKNGISFALAFVSAFIVYALPLITDQRHPGPGNRLLILLTMLSDVVFIAYGYHLLFNYFRKLSLPPAYQSVIGHHHASLDNTLPFIFDMQRVARQEQLKGAFYQNADGIIQVPQCLEKFKRQYRMVPPNDCYLFLKKSIPLLTFILVVVLNTPIFIFSLKDVSQTASEDNTDNEVSQVLYAIAIPPGITLDCYIINKLLYSLLDMVYSRQASDFIVREFPNVLRGMAFLGLVLAILSIDAYKYYPFCESLQAMAVSKSPLDIVGYVATVTIETIVHIFTFIEISKTLIKCYIEFLGSEEKKDKLKISATIEEMKFSIARMRSDVDISNVPEKLDDSEPQNIFERRFNYFFHNDVRVPHEEAAVPLLN